MMLGEVTVRTSHLSDIPVDTRESALDAAF